MPPCIRLDFPTSCHMPAYITCDKINATKRGPQKSKAKEQACRTGWRWRGGKGACPCGMQQMPNKSMLAPPRQIPSAKKCDYKRIKPPAESLLPLLLLLLFLLLLLSTPVLSLACSACVCVCSVLAAWPAELVE